MITAPDYHYYITEANSAFTSVGREMSLRATG